VILVITIITLELLVLKLDMYVQRLGGVSFVVSRLSGCGILCFNFRSKWGIFNVRGKGDDKNLKLTTEGAGRAGIAGLAGWRSGPVLLHVFF
jgi:hypothetical protein